MFEASGPVRTAELIVLRDRLALDPVSDDAGLLDRIRVLEEIKSAAGAAQARVTSDFAASQRAKQIAEGAPVARAERGVAAQVALARRISPHRAAREVGWAKILTTELPGTLHQLQAGRTSTWRAMLVARETAWLSRADRQQLDRDIAPRLEALGDREVEAAVRRRAYQLDPHGYVARIRGAAKDRHVSIRPAPDAMARLSALVPVAQGVAAYAALSRDVDAAPRSEGDMRGRGQLMADLLIERLTGQAEAADVPVEIVLVMTDQTLLDSGPHRDAPAEILGHGPTPAAIARDLVHQPAKTVPRWIRRLYRKPENGQLVALESRRRLFTTGQRRFLRLRDRGICRTPWCNAPARHFDHVVPATHKGPTAVHNGQGLCEACNYAKEAPGWRQVVEDGDVLTRTPTGHVYRSRAPDTNAA